MGTINSSSFSPNEIIAQDSTMQIVQQSNYMSKNNAQNEDVRELGSDAVYAYFLSSL